MAESYNFSENASSSNYFNHLLLDAELKEISKLKESSDFDPKDLTVVLQINGLDVRIEDFNKVLKGWGARIERQIKENAHFNDFERAVEQRANELIQEKLGNTWDILNEVESNLWKLDMD